MGEYIKREAAIDAVNDLAGKAPTCSAYEAVWKAVRVLKKIPAADVAPVVYGVWACVNKIDPISGYRCSKCRPIVGFDLTPYCPNCGAKMDGGVDNG